MMELLDREGWLNHYAWRIQEFIQIQLKLMVDLQYMSRGSKGHYFNKMGTNAPIILK